MFIIIALMLAGTVSGYLLRGHGIHRIQAAVTPLIWLLLFLLGNEVGSNRHIIEGIGALGLEAIAIATGSTLGSVWAAYMLWQWLCRHRSEGDMDHGTDNSPHGKKGNGLPGHCMPFKGSLVIVGFFAAGITCGLTCPVAGAVAGSDISFYALCTLMLCVGISTGSDPQTLHSFRTLPKGLLLLPLLTIAGTLAGSLAVGLLLSRRPLADTLAIGSGMAYYSLSSIFITEYRGAEAGTVALLANIIREVTALLAAPLLAGRWGPLTPIAAGGTTTMDTTLPVITLSSGRQFVMLSLYHGFVTDFSVPFLVTFFCSF